MFDQKFDLVAIFVSQENDYHGGIFLPFYDQSNTQLPVNAQPTDQNPNTSDNRRNGGVPLAFYEPQTHSGNAIHTHTLSLNNNITIYFHLNLKNFLQQWLLYQLHIQQQQQQLHHLMDPHIIYIKGKSYTHPINTIQPLQPIAKFHSSLTIPLATLIPTTVRSILSSSLHPF